MDIVALPVGEYVRGDTIPEFTIDVEGPLTVLIAALQMRLSEYSSVALEYQVSDGTLSIEEIPEGRRLIFAKRNGIRLENARYTGDLEVVFQEDNQRKTLMRFYLDVLTDYTR